MHFFNIILYGNFGLFLVLYVFIYKYRRLIGFHLGMNISIVAGGMMGLSSGILLVFQYPFHYTIITIIATLIGMIVGGVFGAIFDYQTLLTGLVNGLMLGIMAPMIGAILTEQFLFIIVLEVLIVFTIIGMAVSIRKS